MALPSSFLDELKARVSLAEVIGRRVKLIRRGREHIGLCPFHNEKTPSFSVVEDKGFYYCFGCGAKGSAIDFVMNTEGLSFPEAVERLAVDAGMEVPRATPEDQEREQRRRTLYDVVEAAAEWFESQLSSVAGQGARDYIHGRGIDPDTVGRFRLGFAPERRDGLKTALLAREISEAQLVEAGLLIVPEDGGDSYDRFRQRLIFPITDRRGRVVAFGGRALGEQKAKYLNSPETPLFHKGALLYNLARAREVARKSGTVVAVEGYMDVIALDQAGISHALAPLGTALTEEQMAEMWKLAPEPVLCFDGDAAGERAAFRAADRALPVLSPGHSLRFIDLPPGEDPDTLVRGQGAEVFSRLIEDSRPLADILWDSLARGRDVTTPERRAGFRQDLRALVKRIADGTVRGYYGDHFKNRLEQAFGGENRQFSGQNSGNATVTRLKGYGNRLSRRHGLGQGDAAPARQREKVLIAALLNHPELVQEVFEEVSDLKIDSAELDNVRKAIIKRATFGAPLDLDGLNTDFSGSATARVIEELTGPGTAKLDPFARPEMPLAQVIEDWTSVFRLHQLGNLSQDLAMAEQAFGDQSTDENWQRLVAIKQAVEDARAQATANAD